MISEKDVEPQRVKFVELMVTFNPGDIALIKSIFDANNILYVIEGENFLQVRPLVEPARIKVDEQRLADAKALLKDFQSGHFGYGVE